MANNTGAAGGGIGFLGALGLLFIGLKLGGVVRWDWWLVLLPLWGPFALTAAFLLVLGAATLITSLMLDDD